MTCGPRNWPTPRSTSTLRCLRQRGQSAGESRDDGSTSSSRSLPKSSRGVANIDAMRSHGAGLIDHLGSMQQRLGRNAADVEDLPAERIGALEQRDLSAPGPRHERRRYSRLGPSPGPAAGCSAMPRARQRAAPSVREPSPSKQPPSCQPPSKQPPPAQRRGSRSCPQRLRPPVAEAVCLWIRGRPCRPGSA